jgi:multiple sugar transport system ATP-binding protein
MTRIRLENIAKTFGMTAVIKGLDLTIEEGEFFTFVGPSGCGKSTILNMIAGLEPVSGGEVLFDGKTVNELSPKERDVAMIFQSYALYPHMTVYENIAFPLTMRKEQSRRIESEVMRVAGLLGLGEYLHRKPKELSGGQRQRVALGRAIVRKPKVFLMDEPLSNLDARLRIEMRAELKKLHQELGITTIYVTHDQSEAMGLSDRIAVLNKGSIEQCDAPRNVYRRPANTFVAKFIGSPPMNLLRCSVRQSAPLTVDCFGAVLSLPATTASDTSDVLVGIRPEDVAVERVGKEGSAAATVSFVEPAGSHNWVDVERDGVKLRAVSKPDDEILPGNRVYLVIAPERISVFDVASGHRL